MIRRPWGAAKPPPGTPIRRGHPLGIGLVGAWACNDTGSRTIRDLTGRNHLALASTTDWAAKGNVRGLRSDAAGEGATVNASTALQLAHPISMVWRFIQLGTPLLDGACVIVSYTNTVTDPYHAYGIEYVSGLYHLSGNSAGVFSRWNFGSVPGSFLTRASLLVGVWTPAGRWAYANGSLVASTTAISSPTYGATPQVMVSTWNNASHNAITDYVLIYNRGLTGPDVARLWHEPYCWMTPPAPRRLSRASPRGIKRRLLEEGLFAEYPGGSRRRS